MKSRYSRLAVQILLMVLLVIGVLVGFWSAIQDVGQKGQQVPLGSCLSFDDGYKFCHSLRLRKISHVEVYENGNQTDLLVIISLQTVEYHGYAITAAGLSIYVEPIH